MQKNIIKNWFTNHKKQSISMVVTLLAIIAFSAYVVLKDNKQKENIIQKQDNKKGTYVLAVDDKPYSEEGNEQVIDPSVEKIENTDPSKDNTLTNKETVKAKNNTNNSKDVQTVSRSNNNVTTNNNVSSTSNNNKPSNNGCRNVPTGEKRRIKSVEAYDETVVIEPAHEIEVNDGWREWEQFANGVRVDSSDREKVSELSEKYGSYQTITEPINPRRVMIPAKTKIVHHDAEYEYVDVLKWVCD